MESDRTFKKVGLWGFENSIFFCEMILVLTEKIFIYWLCSNLSYKSQRKICGFTRDKILNFKKAIRYILTEWKQQKKK